MHVNNHLSMLSLQNRIVLLRVSITHSAFQIVLLHVTTHHQLVVHKSAKEVVNAPVELY